MNTPNPLQPQGSRLEQKSNARSRVKLAVFFVLTIHVVGLMALLVQGCRPEQQEVSDQPLPPPDLPVFDPIEIPPVATNEVLLPPVEDLPPVDGAGNPIMTMPADPILEAPSIESPVLEAPSAQAYKIQKGDTFYSIGKSFGVSMQAIKDANPGVDPTRLQLGQTINIPPAAPVVQDTVVPTMSGEVVYTVVSGDTLSRIANKYDTTWQAIRDLNNLPTTNIKVGQQLRIPASTAPAGGTPGSGI